MGLSGGRAGPVAGGPPSLLGTGGSVFGTRGLCDTAQGAGLLSRFLGGFEGSYESLWEAADIAREGAAEQMWTKGRETGKVLIIRRGGLWTLLSPFPAGRGKLRALLLGREGQRGLGVGRAASPEREREGEVSGRRLTPLGEKGCSIFLQGVTVGDAREGVLATLRPGAAPPGLPLAGSAHAGSLTGLPDGDLDGRAGDGGRGSPHLPPCEPAPCFWVTLSPEVLLPLPSPPVGFGGGRSWKLTLLPGPPEAPGLWH